MLRSSSLRLSSRLRSTQCRASLSTHFDDDLAEEIDDEIKKHASLRATSVSIQMLMKTCRGDLASYQTRSFMGRLGQRLADERILINMASLLRKEIPIRLAHRIQDLDQVPMMKDMPSVIACKHIYIQSFKEMIDWPPIFTPQDEQAFAEMLGTLYMKHANILVQMARGAYELRAAVAEGQYGPTRELDFTRLTDCHCFLDRFYMSRIGIRVLAGQYLELRTEKRENYIGMICLKTSPSDVVREAAEHAKQMCRRQYARAPMIEITGRLDLTFPFIPTYLHYIVLELLKNALRATCETHQGANLPKVSVIIADGMDNEDVVIKIADEGGGIRRSQVDKIWSYLYTTADPKIQEAFIGNQAGDHDDASPIAGLGYGLPISKSYCEFFGGALDLVSMEGYGTDAFIHLKRLGDTKEPQIV